MDDQTNQSSDGRINRLQENLGPIRKVAKMSASDLASEIGVSRQTISSLENQKTRMTKTQYLALRSVFNYKASGDPALAQIIKALVDDPIDDDQTEQEAALQFRESAMAGATAVTAILAGVLPFPASIIPASGFIAKHIADSRKNK